MKRMITFVLSLAMVCSLVVPSLAAELTTNGASSAETTLTYGVSESYVVTVPEAAYIGENKQGVLEVSIANAMLSSNTALNVYITGTSYTDGAWHLTDTATATNKLPYTITSNNTTIAHNDVVLSVSAGEAWNRTVTAVMTLALTGDVTQSGRYSDQLTFRVEKANATSTQGTYKLKTTAFDVPYATITVTEAEVQEYIDIYGGDAEMAIATEKFAPYVINIAPMSESATIFQDGHYVESQEDTMQVTGFTPCITWAMSGDTEQFMGLQVILDGVQVILPVSLDNTEITTLVQLLFFSLTENNEELLSWWNQNTIKINNKTGSGAVGTICHHSHSDTDGTAYEMVFGYDMTWEELKLNDSLNLYETMVFPVVDGVKYVALQGENATTAALVTYKNGVPVKATESIQKGVVYETEVVPAFTTSTANSVYAFKENLTAMSVADLNMSYSSNYHDIYSDEELQAAYNKYLIPGMQPVACRQSDSYIKIYGCTAVLASSSPNAEPFVIYKVSVGNSDYETIQYNMLSLSELDDALLLMLRYFNRDDTVSTSNEMSQWVNANLTKVSDEYRQVNSIFIGQGNSDAPAINYNVEWVWTFMDGETWSDCVAYMGWSVDSNGYIYVPLSNNARWYLSMGYGNNKVNVADVVQYKHYIFGVLVEETGEKYYCPHCYQYSSVFYGSGCSNGNCDIDEVHCGLCHANPYIQHIAGHKVYYTPEMTWGEWMESEYARWNFGEWFWNDEGRLVTKTYADGEYQYLAIYTNNTPNGAYDYVPINKGDVMDNQLDYELCWDTQA